MPLNRRKTHPHTQSLLKHGRFIFMFWDGVASMSCFVHSILKFSFKWQADESSGNLSNIKYFVPIVRCLPCSLPGSSSLLGFPYIKPTSWLGRLPILSFLLLNIFFIILRENLSASSTQQEPYKSADAFQTGPSLFHMSLCLLSLSLITGRCSFTPTPFSKTFSKPARESPSSIQLPPSSNTKIQTAQTHALMFLNLSSP